jgi:hypothetical protein
LFALLLASSNSNRYCTSIPIIRDGIKDIPFPPSHQRKQDAIG